MNSHLSAREGLDIALRHLDALAPSGYAIILHLRGLSCRMVERTYPVKWVKQYNENGYALRDPVVGWCMEHTGLLRWSDPALPDPYDIMGQAARHGLKFGASVSLGPRQCRSVISVARADRELTDDENAHFEEISRTIHGMFPLNLSLSRKQTEALVRLATGMRTKQAADSLGISDSAFKFRIRTAREKLNARTTAEAIQRAKDYNLI
ncbi:helix-turn-helix transcriptional regulator [Palleronia abyssalis]|uniref:Transcriptional activator protein AnoR n=1 Tax=Palleronia abyssalis TaxID=1501240 RepID=A0A2R8BXK8_9RHOB|nr:autoinducer binding domain-containing protein [Palleronia abyssalis]SPJ24914.1 Transcriptional activator protein AnoR [Palleronia abyssalis]